MTVIITNTKPPAHRTLVDIDLIDSINSPIFTRWDGGNGDGELYMLTTNLNVVGITGELSGELFNVLSDLVEHAGEDLYLRDFVIIENVEILTSN